MKEMIINSVPLKRAVLINAHTLPEDTPADFLFRYVDIGSVGHGELIAELAEISFGHAPSRARRRVQPGDTLLSTVRTYLRAVLPVKERGLVASTGFACLTPSSQVEPRYLGWWAQSDVCIEEVVARSVGVSYPAINPSELGSIEFPLSSMSAQQIIADFLDSETARINRLIAKKRELVKLLDARLQRSIEEVALVEALGPQVRLKQVVTIERGRFNHRPRNDPSLYGGEFPFVQTGDIRAAKRYIEQATQFLSLQGSRVSRSFPVGTSLMGIAANVGDVAITTFETWCPDSIVGFVPQMSIDSDYLYFVLKGLRRQINETSTENTQENTNIERLGILQFPLPSLDTQRRIAGDLRDAETRANSLSAVLDRQIALLREHRQALITAAVTGEMEIPGVPR